MWVEEVIEMIDGVEGEIGGDTLISYGEEHAYRRREEGGGGGGRGRRRRRRQDMINWCVWMW